MTDLAYLSASQLAARIRAREVSSREAVDAALTRIAVHDARVHAVVALDPEHAHARAAEADAALAHGEIAGPLHGVPMLIKDVWEVAGMRSTAGAPEYAQHVPRHDATAVARLRHAGAIIIGKTNVPAYASDLQSYNSLFPTTNNPFDETRTPGGSSGGAAVALATGMTPLELGSDIGGSIRHPANWTGVFGHKSTYGIIPSRGHIPPPPGWRGTPDLGVFGPLARCADDLALGLSILAGPQDDDAVAWRLELPAPRHRALRDYRVAAWLDDSAAPVDSDVSARLHATVDALRHAGVSVDEKARPVDDLASLVDTYLRLLAPEVMGMLPQPVFDGLAALAAANPDDPGDLARMARYTTETVRDRMLADGVRHQIRARVATFFRDFDVLLMPVNPVPAIAHDHSEPMPMRRIRVNGAERPYFDLFSWIALATMAYLPATVAPAGRTPGGLPVGVQIVGPYLGDRTTIDFAAKLEALLGGFHRPPGF